jgi:hypothetical protein
MVEVGGLATGLWTHHLLLVYISDQADAEPVNDLRHPWDKN